MEKLRFPHGFGFAFDIDASPITKSGFQPADLHKDTGLELGGDLRLAGFAAALKSCAVEHLTVIGRDEPRMPSVNQADAIVQMLHHDYGIPLERLAAHRSGDIKGDTALDAKIISEIISLHGYALTDCVGLSSMYHTWRVDLNLYLQRVPILVLPAEAFILLAAPDPDERDAGILKIKESTIKSLDRYIAELTGVGRLIDGSYSAR
jgi:hypothetical protein